MEKEKSEKINIEKLRENCVFPFCGETKCEGITYVNDCPVHKEKIEQGITDYSMIELEKRVELQSKLRNHKGVPQYICEMFSDYVQSVRNHISNIHKNFVFVKKLTDLEENVLKTVKAHVPKEIIDDNNQVDPECLIFDINNNFKAFLEGLNDGC